MNISTFASSLGFEPHSVTGMIKTEWFSEHLVYVDSTEFSDGTRRAGTSIYLLLSGQEKMTWHKLKSDEVLFFHHGVPLKIHMILSNGQYQAKLLGNKLTNEEASFQVVIPHTSWFAYELTDPTQYALYSEVVSPGFEFKDWSAPPEGGLVPLFPQHKAVIESLSGTNRASADFKDRVLVRSENFSNETMDLIISKLQLSPHPVCRGGVFNEVWKTEHSVTVTNGRHEGKRFAGSSIYMVLTAGNNGLGWHIHLSDELLIHHGGGAIKFHFMDQAGNYSFKILGDPLSCSDANYQVLVPNDTWYAFELLDQSQSVFFAAVLAPAFEFGDWKDAEEKGVDLLQKYPQHADIVKKMAAENWIKE